VPSPPVPGRPDPPRALLIDLGGVLLSDDLPACAARWAARLGIAEAALLAAVYGGSDDQVLTGRVSEPDWWRTVQARLGLSPALTAELRRDVAALGTPDQTLMAVLARVPARVAIVSNAWPHLRERAAVLAADVVVLSCDAGWAKPDPRIFRAALTHLGAAPADALLIDDTPAHVAAARALGLAAHRHRGTAGTVAAIERFVCP
jgi:putative hydrolase of the HAD superfamily